MLPPLQEVAEEAQVKAGDLFGKGREYFEEQKSRLVGRPAMKEKMGKIRNGA